MHSQKILFVDDDPNLLAGFERNFRKVLKFDTALSGPEALRKIEAAGPYAVIVADMQMPVMNGIELLTKVRVVSPDTVRVMLTGNADQQTAVEAVNRGAISAFLNKPCEPDQLRAALDVALKQYELVCVERELLEQTLAGSVKVLAEVLSMVDPVSFGRGQKLRDSMREFGRWLGETSTWQLEMAASLADLGLVSLPHLLLRKLEQGGELSPRERDMAEKAPQIGHDLLVSIPRLAPVAEIILYQRKHYDGTGFPSNPVKGQEIPLGARMLRILQDRAVLESDGVVKSRAYEMMKSRGAVYDQTLLQKCFEWMKDFLVNPISADKPVLAVDVWDLKPGQILVSDVKTLQDLLLVSAGNRLTEVIIRRLNNYTDYDRIKSPIYVQ